MVAKPSPMYRDSGQIKVVLAWHRNDGEE